MNSKKIFIIDDSKMILNFLNNFLGKSFEIECFDKGSVALGQITKNNYPDLIICDQIMPNDLSGNEVLKEVRLRNEFIPFIILTANTEVESKIQFFQCGANDVVEKPFNPMVLQARINNLLDQDNSKSLYQFKNAI